MKAINIDENNRLIINPMEIDTNKFITEEAKTEATAIDSFTYVEPVTFGTGCFGNPNAFNRLQEILHTREENNAQTQNEVITSQETNFVPLQENDAGMEPAFC